MLWPQALKPAKAILHDTQIELISQEIWCYTATPPLNFENNF